MVIQSSKLHTGKDFTVRGEVPPDALEAYLDGFEGFRALRPLSYDVRLTNRGRFISLEAEADTEVELCCHRCGGSFTRELRPHIDLKLVESVSFDGADEIVLSEEDLDTVTYVAPNIDLDGILLESIYLDLDDECVCREDCKGVCLKCGKNLNESACSCL